MNIYKAIIPVEPEKHRKGKPMKKKNNLTFFKGFDKNMQCLGFQYEENFTYTHDGPVKLSEEGFQACDLPLDTLTYYPLTDGTQYHQVELGGVSDETDSDSKRVGKTITVGGELSLFGLIQAHVEIVKNKAKNDTNANAATTGDHANAATTGRYANAATTGYSTNIRTSVQDSDSVSAVLGQGAAKGVKGSWLVLTERNNDLTIVEVRATQVDGKNVKADTYYQLINGELVEVDE